MDAIILAAGKSTRTYPLTLTRPKPLLKAANKAILEHNVEQLDGLVEKIVLVVGYKKEMIIDFVENNLKPKFKNIKVEFVEQKKQLGTGHAVLQAEKLVGEKFIIMNGDDFYSKDDIKQIMKYDYALLTKEVEDCSRFGALVTEGDKVKDIVEKSKQKISNMANIGLYCVKKDIFSVIKALQKSERDEYEITDAIKELAKTKDVFYKTVKDYWVPITYAWNLLEANEFFLSKIKTDIHGTIEERATIKGNIILGKGSVIKNGAYIEGPAVIGENSVIGPNCYIRACTTIGDDCKIGNAVEIKNSIIGDHVNVCHLSYLGDSVMGDNINIGAGTVAANVRLDKKNIEVAVNGGLVDSGRKKLGVIMSDNTQTGIHSSIMPGSTINPETFIYPNTVVGVDKGK